MAAKRPILFISDAVAGSSGLSRITRDLSTRVHEHLGDLYRVGTVGYGAAGSCKFGFQQYTLEGMHEWVCPTLPEICDDFFGKEKGIICTIWDSHRLTWLAAPRGCSELFSKFPGLQQWAMSRPFELWGYVPIDSSGPNDRLTFPIMKTLLGFDRLLAYGKFGEGVIRRTIGDEESDKRHLTHLPHGIDSSVFYEQDRKLSRKLFLSYTGAMSFLHMIGMEKETASVADDEVLIGCIATNQPRKDLALAAETIAILSREKNVRFWLHTDSLERTYSVPNLLIDFGIVDRTVISLGMIPDDKMATAYTACDLTIGPGLGEGFGFPLLESQFCGTPVVSGSYAGGGDIVPKDWLIDPIAFRYEGSYASKRPVYNAEEWAAMAIYLIGKRCTFPGKYDWERLWPRWESWFRGGTK